MTPVLYRLGQLCVRHRWFVLGVWLVVFAALAFAARSVGPNVNDNLTLPGTDSQRATDLLTARFPAQANGTNPVVLTAPKGAKLTDDKYAQAIDSTVSAFRRDPDVREATSPLSSAGKAYLTKDAQIGYIALNLRTSPTDLSRDDAERVVAEADPVRDAGLTVGVGGYLGQKVSKPETHSSEAVGLTMAVIVLLFTFGSVVAMGLPIATAVVGLVVGLSIITLISQVAEVPTVAPTLATMIGLGVGIDYALFIVTRHQAQRRGGMATDESVARADRDVRRRGRLRRHDGDRRAAVARGRRHPARHDARLHRGDRRRGRGRRRGHAAPGPARPPRAAHRRARPAVPARAAGRPPPARLGALGAIRRAPAAAERARGRRDPRRPGPAGARPLLRPAGQRRAADEHRGAPRVRRHDGRLRRRRERPAAGRGRHGEPARDRRPEPARPDRQAGVRPEGPGPAEGRRPGEADRREPRGPGRAAGAGPVAGRGAGQAPARRADEADRAAGRRPAPEGRPAGDRPAPSGPARRPGQDGGRRLRDPAARQRLGQRGRDDGHAEVRPLGPGDRAARPPAARRHDPGRDEGPGDGRRRRRYDRGLRRPGRRDLGAPRPDDRRRRRR